jgi:hypothetical protein
MAKAGVFHKDGEANFDANHWAAAGFEICSCGAPKMHGKCVICPPVKKEK